MVAATMNKIFSTSRNDITAGVVVFLVALPLCLGIALASGAPIISGILSGIVGGIIVGAISGSHTSVSGPAAGLTAVIAAQLATLPSFEVFLAAVIIAGIIQICMGLAKMGFLAEYFPSSVIKGLLCAIGVILILKQLPHLVGWDADYEGDMAFFQPDNETTFSELLKMFSNFHVGATIVGISSLVLLLLFNRYNLAKKLKIPAPLIIVVFGSLLSLLLPFFNSSWAIGATHRVHLPSINGWGEIPSLLTFPDLSMIFNSSVILAGVTLALVASLETLLNLEAVDKIDPLQRKSPPSRELIAQGSGNICLGFIGGLPVTSVIIRSSVNIQYNAKTKFSAIFHGILLVISVLFLPHIINAIPLATLAAILIMTGLKLSDARIFKQMWAQGNNQFVPFLTTLLAIVFSDLLIGVLIGMAVSVFFILKSNFENPLKVIKEKHVGKEVTRIIFANQVSFLNRASLSQALNNIPHGHHVVLDANDAEYVDADVLDMINDFKNDAASKKNIELSLVGFVNNNQSAVYTEHTTSEVQKNSTPEEILHYMQAGNSRTLEGRRLRRDLKKQISATSGAQYPLAVTLSCIDSRVPAELVFDLGIGDIFSIRMAGNVVSKKVLGSLEYAVAVAQAKLIVVMGHTRCGAVSSAITSYRNGEGINNVSECKNLEYIVKDIQSVIKEVSSQNIPFHQIENQIVKQNVIRSIKSIKRESPIISRLLFEKRIAIAGCIYDVGTGKVEFLPLGDGLYDDVENIKIEEDSILHAGA